MTARLDVAEFLTGYLAEAEEHLANARACLTTIDEAIQKNEHSPKAVRELFRAVHTLKGLSAMVGAEPIVDLAHEMETLFRSADKAGGKLPAHALDVMVKGLRAIEERIASLAKGEALAPAPKALIDALSMLHVETSPARQGASISLSPEVLAKLAPAEHEQLLQGVAKGRRVLRVDFVPSQARSAAGLSITSVRKEMSKIGDLVKVLPRSIPQGEGRDGSVAFILLVVTDATDEEIAGVAATTPDRVERIALAPAEVESRPSGTELEDEVPSSPKRNVVRVDVRRLDDALEGLSALVVSRWRLERAVAALAAGQATTRDVSNLLVESGRQLRRLRAAIMSARMVPVSELLERAPLLVRGLARSSGKMVHLGIDEGDSELDKSVVDRLFPAIVHLLRNAVDHAMESPAERQARGKPPEGQIRIRCHSRSATQLALVISDDGRGIDAAKVAARAGAPVPEDAAQLLALITRTGLSTLDQATRTSGRGLGMDIVKRIVVDELGGELCLRTEVGVGTEFTLIVPLSVTILDVFSFACGDRTFVVPVSSVEDLTEVEPSAVTEAPTPNGGLGRSARLLHHRGATLPLFALGTLLGFERQATERRKAILVRRDSETYAFEVDRMLGQQEVVVRPVSDPLVSVRGVSGSTDLGDGEPTLVLDLLSLVQASPNVSHGAFR